MSDLLYAILTTAHGCPGPGTRLLIAMPTSTTNPHVVGRVATAEPRGDWIHGGRALKRFVLTIAVENADNAAVKREFSGHAALDCYLTLKEAERWHAVDD